MEYFDCLTIIFPFRVADVMFLSMVTLWYEALSTTRTQFCGIFGISCRLTIEENFYCSFHLDSLLTLNI
jgi:hypothetical protein